jgi:uncharacterized protein (DUF2147 family)
MRSVAIIALLLLPPAARATDPALEARDILGIWLTTDGKAHIEIYQCGDLYCGKIVWLSEPLENGQPKRDKENPDEALRDRPIIGLILVRDFSYDGDGAWSGGKVYDPESGDEYQGKMSLKDAKTLDLRGYVLLPLFGRTETWTRVETGPK